MNRRVFALAAFGLGVFVLCARPMDAEAAPKITEATLGTAIDADYQIATPMTEFAATTAKIHCAWEIDDVDGEVAVRAAWIATDVGKVAPANFKIDEATIKMAGDGKGSFSLSKPNAGFPIGQYRVEIYIGDKLAKIVPFIVK